MLRVVVVVVVFACHMCRDSWIRQESWRTRTPCPVRSSAKHRGKESGRQATPGFTPEYSVHGCTPGQLSQTPTRESLVAHPRKQACEWQGRILCQPTGQSESKANFPQALPGWKTSFCLRFTSTCLRSTSETSEDLCLLFHTPKPRTFVRTGVEFESDVIPRT